MSRPSLFDDPERGPTHHERAAIEAGVGCELHALELFGRETMKTIRSEKDYVGKVRIFAGNRLTVDDETCAELLAEDPANFMVVDEHPAAEVPGEPEAEAHEPKKSKKGKHAETDVPGAPPEE